MSKPDKVRVLIVDDEPLARQRLEDLLASYEDVEIAGHADTGDRAIEMIRSNHIDLVFLDVQMPGRTGLEVVEEITADRMPLTIFVTAYDKFALKAFELAAIDYLLKPFDDERFEQAFDRARKTLRLQEVDQVRDRLLALLQADEPQAKSGAPYLERIAVEMRGQVRVVMVDDIDFITASGPYAELHVGDEKYLIREQMQTLEDRLNPDDFFRIHRSTIVRLNLIQSLHHAPGGDYAVSLRNGKRLKVSRSRRDELARRLGVDSL